MDLIEYFIIIKLLVLESYNGNEVAVKVWIVVSLIVNIEDR